MSPIDGIFWWLIFLKVQCLLVEMYFTHLFAAVPDCYGLTSIHFPSWFLNGFTSFWSKPIILQLRKLRPKGEVVMQLAEPEVECWSLSQPVCLLLHHVPQAGMPCLNKDEKQMSLVPGMVNLGGRDNREELRGNRHCSLSSTTTWPLRSLATPSNDGIFSRWEGSRSFSFPPPPPPL